MSYRGQTRAFNAKVEKKRQKLELRKITLAKAVIKETGENPFDEISITKTYWFIKYAKSGLKMAPLTVWSIWKFSFAYRLVKTKLETVSIRAFGYLFRINNWTIRENWTIRDKKKPKGAIWKLRFSMVAL
jgi:hypothetical protein